MIAGYQENGSLVELLGSPRVYVHEINTLPGFERIIPQVDGIEKYDRATALARPEDVVLLKAEPDGDYLQWLEEIGLGTRKLVVLDGEPSETLPMRMISHHVRDEVRRLLDGGRPRAVMSAYYGGHQELRASNYIGVPLYANTPVVQRYDSKIEFKALCRRLGVPVLSDVVFTAGEGSARLRALVSDAIRETGATIVRGEFGASASTTYIYTGEGGQSGDSALGFAEMVVAESKPTDRFVVEAYHRKFSSPSSLWFITRDGRISHLRSSDQLLSDGVSHAGNEVPMDRAREREIDDHSFRVARALAYEGFIGPFGIDFMETERGIFASECNPRVTGAMYPWELVRTLQRRHGCVPAARSENIHMPRKGLRFADLQRAWGEWLYDGGRGVGVAIPFNVGPIASGKVTVVFTANSRDELNVMREDMDVALKRLR